MKLKALFLSLLLVNQAYGMALFELKTGYFIFSDSKMQKVYDRGGVDVQLCTSYPLWNHCKWTLNAYGAIEFFQRSGRSINGHQKTSLWSLPMNFGLRPVYAINAQTDYYFAIGPRYFYVNQHNSSSYVTKNNSKNGLGLFVNTGFNYKLCNCLVLDIFGEYSYAKTRLHSKKSNVYTRNVQVGGFTIGGGLGIEF